MNKVKTAYQQALVQRDLYPLKSGAYKLAEVKDFAKRYYAETQRIAQSKRTGINPSLLHCTSEDMHSWLKSAPVYIADEFGYKVVAAVKALTGDGLDPQDVQDLTNRIQPSIDELLNQCKIVDNLIRKNIQLEYKHMKRNDSLVADLYHRLYMLVDFILDEVNAYTESKYESRELDAV